MPIAGCEIGLPRDESELTAEWVTAALRCSGALPADASVSSLTSCRIGEGVGMLSRLYRLTPTYDRPVPGAPASLVAKLPAADPQMRYLADTLNAYGREVAFYREAAASAPFGSADCHAAAIDESGDCVILMQDMAGLRSLDQITGCTWEEAELACDVLADFHAQWHGDPRLPGFTDTFWGMVNPVYPVLLPAMFQTGWPIARREMAKDLSPEMIRYGDHWTTLCHYAFAQLSEPQTLLHGDFRADNLFIDDGRVTALDFQIAMVGPGIYDLAYFVSQSIRPEVRARRDRQLVDRYIARMASHGVTLDAAETWRLYQLSLAYCLIYPMAVFPSWDTNNERGRELMRTLLMRCATAIEETGALEVFPETAWTAPAPAAA
jgi:hypothetical protein